MKKLLALGPVLYSELKPLTAGEKIILTKIKNKKSHYFYSTLGVLLLVILISYIYAINIRSSGRTYYRRLSEDELIRIRTIAPIFFTLTGIALLIYFRSFYRKLVLPYIKDLKSEKKEILYYSPDKYQTPFFAEYYITTPLTEKFRVKVSKEIFDEIDPNSKACMSLGQFSRFVFGIEVDVKKINFNETDEPVDV